MRDRVFEERKLQMINLNFSSVAVLHAYHHLELRDKKIRGQETRTSERKNDKDETKICHLRWERENFNQVSSIARSMWILVIINAILTQNENKKCISACVIEAKKTFIKILVGG